MSDQPSPSSQKPKPGSLRDRIAAFESTATTPASAGQRLPPVPRPKPSGFASWKPKVPSPPSSPSSKSTDYATAPPLKAMGAMSASDAKESITKGGGSLKDRMAALQGKGAFGAPSPPLAPKPAVEKPKRNPLPAAADKDASGDEPPATAIAATLDRTKSPPVQPRESPDLSKSIVEGEGTSTADSEPTASTGGDVEGTTNPEEEDRQRRAAIAARMARLGGARLGMAPSGLAKKPPMPIRKPTREDAPKQENREKRQSITLEGNVPLPPNADQGVTTASSTTSLTDSPRVQPQSDIELPPVRKNSGNVSVDSTDSITRTPHSMPVPTVPRRAGPPRKKPTKPPPEVPETPMEEAIAAPSIISTADDHKAVEKEEEAILVPEHKEPEPKIIDDHRTEIHDEPRSIDVHPAEELVVENKPAISGESKEGPAHDIQSSPPDELKQEHEHEHEHEQNDHPDQPGDVDTIREDQAEEDEIIDTDEHSDYDEKPSDEHHEDQHLQRDDDHHVGTEPQSNSTIGATATDEDAEEEEARRKRVAERLAKMGGINPFALPPRSRLSLEETGHADSSVVSSHASPESVAVPVSTGNPTRKASLPSHEVAEPHPLAVEPKVEEQAEKEFSDGIEEGSSDDASIHKEVEHSPPPPPQYQQVESAPVRQLPDPLLRPPVPGSTRPHVQVQQYGRHDADEEHNAHHATRYLPPLSRLPDPPQAISHEESPLPPARPAQPPRRIVPQAPEEQEQEEEEEEGEAGSDDEVVPSHLFVRPPRDQHPVRAERHYEADDDGSDNDTPALPVLQRRSVDSIAPPPPASLPSHHHNLPTSPSDISEHDSDNDGQELPVRPRHTAVPPTHPSPVLLRLTPRRSVPSAPENEESSYGTPLVAVSEPEPGEVLDDEEGDPIDPAFHSPSRRASEANIRASAQDDNLGQLPSPPLPVLPAKVEKREEAQQQQEQDQTKRQTLAERMAKLGGIKFGTALIPPAVSRPPVPRVSQGDRDEEDGHSEHHSQADAEHVEQSAELSEGEDEERARKERISAKLAGMGGMRIGMMPMGMGPRRAHVLKDDNVAPLSPTRDVLPTLPQTPDTASKRTSNDGVKVEGEMEEVDYEDVAEETTPPPVPSRGGQAVNRRESTGIATSLPSPPISGSRPLVPAALLSRRESTGAATSLPSPAIAGSRPPVPAALLNRRESTGNATSLPSPSIAGSRPPVPAASPNRRASVQTPKSTGSVEVGFSPLRSTFSHVFPQSEYVIVDEPHSLEEGTPPSRRTSRIAPLRSPPNLTGIPHTSDPNSISSHWELPSIPTAALDLGNSADLSMSSWTDVGEPTSPTSQLSPPPAKQPSLVSRRPKPSELQLSADDLMTMWGRVGVQVCEVATNLFENSKKTIIGDGTYAGFITAVLSGVPNAAPISIASGEYGYLVYAQNGSSVQKRASEIMPGDIVEIHEGKLKGHKGIQTYHQNVGGSGEALLGIVGEFEAKKSKIRVFHANQHVGQQFVESVSYRLEDLKSGTVKVYRVLEEG